MGDEQAVGGRVIRLEIKPIEHHLNPRSQWIALLARTQSAGERNILDRDQSRRRWWQHQDLVANHEQEIAENANAGQARHPGEDAPGSAGSLWRSEYVHVWCLHRS